MTENKVATNY